MVRVTDKALEREISDKISFMNFLVFPEKAPYSSTIWLFRERLIKTGKYDLVWEEINSQLDSLGLVVKNGSIQDATFITADPGHASADKPRGDEAKTRRSSDGTWTKKGSKTSFGGFLLTSDLRSQEGPTQIFLIFMFYLRPLFVSNISIS